MCFLFLMAFLSPRLKGRVIKMIHPKKCPNHEALKLLPFFSLLLNTAKIKQCSLYCLKLLIYIEVSGFSWLFELEFHMPPNTVELNWYLPRAMSAQGMNFPCAKAMYAHGPMLRALQVLCCADAVPAFSCCSVILLRTNLSTDYLHGCKLPITDRGCSGLYMVLKYTSEKLSPHEALQKGKKSWP